MRRWMVVAALVLAGCATTDWDALRAKADGIRAECRQKRRAGELASAQAEQRCGNEPIEKLYADSDPTSIFVPAEDRWRLDVARLLDTGVITEAQANKFLADIDEEERDHDQAEKSADAGRLRAFFTNPDRLPSFICTTYGHVSVCE